MGGADLERSILIPDASRESLAAKPAKYVLKASQRHLSIRLDLKKGHLRMKH